MCAGAGGAGARRARRPLRCTAARGAADHADELRDIYAARRVYEIAGLEALLRRRPVDVSWLGAAGERMGEAAIAGDDRALVEADMAFHLAIVAAAGVAAAHARRAGRADGAAARALRGRPRGRRHAGAWSPTTSI